MINKFKKQLKKKNIEFDVLKTSQYIREKILLRIIHKYDALLCGDDEITKKVIDKATNLKVISKWGTGIDSIDKNYAIKKGIKIFNTPGAFTNGVATMALAMLLSFYRKINENHNDIKKGQWKKYPGETLIRKKIGVIGVGNIGKTIFEMLQGFNTINYGNDLKKIDKKFLNKNNIKIKNKKFLYNNCDVLIFATDLNKNSYKMINKYSVKELKKKPLIINVGRGGVIDNKTLIYALKMKKINGACLDVFENEPLKKNNPLKNFKNCIFTSHNAFNTKDEVEFVHKNTLHNLYKGLRLSKVSTFK